MTAPDRLRTLLRLHALRDRPDADLLRLFADRRDEAAFELLVRRHGPLVLGVCRRAVGDALADDAFQATFLLLARRGAALREPAGVARWLFGTAARVCREARRQDRRRRRRERAAARPEVVVPRSDDSAMVDAAVRRLPEPFRSAVLLCDLGGRTRDEAARELGVPAGTVASRVGRGRALLAAMLRREGLVAGAAVVPAGLSASTARVAGLVLLTHGGRTMLPLAFWKVVAGVLVLGGAAVVGTGGQKPADPPAAANRKELTAAERLRAIQAEYDAENKAGMSKGKDQRTGEEIDISPHIGPDKYLPRLLELGRGPDEPTAAAALCWASHRWGYPTPAESDPAFKMFLQRFAAGPHAGEFARDLIAVAGYGDNADRLRQVLERAADRTARGPLELKYAHMANPRRGGRRQNEPTANLALRRDVALAVYDRLAAEYPDLDGGKLAATAKQEAAKLRANQDLPELAKPPARP